MTVKLKTALSRAVFFVAKIDVRPDVLKCTNRLSPFFVRTVFKENHFAVYRLW